MTNLIEKSLIIGFGILLLLIFLPLINPLLTIIYEFNDNYNEEIIPYEKIVYQIDYGINSVIKNPRLNYYQEVEYPNNLNITFYNQYARFDYIIKNQVQSKITFYNKSFLSQYYYNILPQIYLLNISFDFNLLNVQITIKI